MIEICSFFFSNLWLIIDCSFLLYIRCNYDGVETGNKNNFYINSVACPTSFAMSWLKLDSPLWVMTVVYFLKKSIRALECQWRSFKVLNKKNCVSQEESIFSRNLFVTKFFWKKKRNDAKWRGWRRIDLTGFSMDKRMCTYSSCIEQAVRNCKRMKKKKGKQRVTLLFHFLLPHTSNKSSRVPSRWGIVIELRNLGHYALCINFWFFENKKCFLCLLFTIYGSFFVFKKFFFFICILRFYLQIFFLIYEKFSHIYWIFFYRSIVPLYSLILLTYLLFFLLFLKKFTDFFRNYYRNFFHNHWFFHEFFSYPIHILKKSFDFWNSSR